MTEGLSAADVLALTNRGSDPATTAALLDRDGMDGIWNNPFVYLVWIMVFAMFGRNGFGFGNDSSAATQGALTRSDMNEGFLNAQIQDGIRGIQNGLCDGFYAMNNSIMQGFNGVGRDLCSGFNGINQNINQSRFDTQQCCCDIERNIDAVRFENSRNTCDIVNAIRTDGEQTRTLINANTMQELRDKLAERDREVMARDFQLSQQSQNAYLVNQLRPCPIPAYPSCSPYASYNWGDVFGGRACGCGCG